MPANTVYVGRPTKWGNPYKVGETNELGLKINNELACNLFAMHMIFDGRDIADAARRELKGKNLACWCPLDKPCHADILLKIANERR